MKKTISEIRKEGISALSKALGPVDMARFIQSYGSGMVCMVEGVDHVSMSRVDQN